MLPITSVFDTARFQRDLAAYGRQAVFASAVAINRTLEQKQAQLRAHVTSRLTIRNGKARQLFADVIRFGASDRADVKRQQLSGRIVVLGGQTEARTNLFRRFGQMVIRHEQGGTVSSNALYRAQNNQLTVGGFAIPAPGLRSATKAMPRALYPKNVGLSTRQAISGGTEFARQYKGGKKKRGGFKKDTRYYFVKEGVGIFVREQRRVAKGPRKGISMASASRGFMDKSSEYDAVWFFRPRIRLPRTLKIEETYIGGLEERFRVNYETALADALRSAR
ncbi:hypothetical protein [Gemmatimonas sp.]